MKVAKAEVSYPKLKITPVSSKTMPSLSVLAPSTAPAGSKKRVTKNLVYNEDDDDSDNDQFHVTKKPSHKKSKSELQPTSGKIVPLNTMSKAGITSPRKPVSKPATGKTMPSKSVLAPSTAPARSKKRVTKSLIYNEDDDESDNNRHAIGRTMPLKSVLAPSTASAGSKKRVTKSLVYNEDDATDNDQQQVD